MSERRRRRKGETDNSDCFHVVVGKGEETLPGERHMALPFTILVALFVLEFVPEGLGGETRAGRSVDGG